MNSDGSDVRRLTITLQLIEIQCRGDDVSLTRRSLVPPLLATVLLRATVCVHGGRSSQYVIHRVLDVGQGLFNVNGRS